jgi:hypothetical protein
MRLAEMGEVLRAFFEPVLNDLAAQQRLAALDRLARDAHNAGLYEKNAMPKDGSDK